MSKVINVGYTDTPISGVTSLKLTRGLVNFGADFRVKKSDPSEAILTNLTSPIDRPEKARFAYSEIANIYSGTGIDPSVYAPTKQGVSALTQLTEVWSITDSTDPSFRVDIPVSFHTVLKVGASEYITDAMIETLIGRGVSLSYETGSETTTRIKSLLRGSLLPADLK